MNYDLKPTTRPLRVAATPATRAEYVGTVLFGSWMTVGLFFDGYFHQNLDSDGESFVTLWHAVFYSGFTATAVWMIHMSCRRSDGALDWRLRSLPPGFDGARWGLALFAAGGVGDAGWHGAFGVERGIDALLSPTHLLLFAGLVLILTAPLRAASTAAAAPPGPWVLVGSLVSATALVGFFLNFAWGLGIAAQARVPYDPVTGAGETAVIAGVASTLVTTAVLFIAARILIAKGPPRGALVVLFTVVALFVSAAFDEDAEGVAAAFAAGVIFEVLVGAGRASQRRWSLAGCFAAAAGCMWVAYLSLLAVLDGIEWPTEIWTGTAVLNALAAVVLASVAGPVHGRAFA